MSKTIKGSCLCGKNIFEVIGDFESFFLCHCRYCQKDTGSAHAANLFSTTAKLVWHTDQKNLKTFTLNNTRHTKCFCNHCGSALPGAQMEGRLLVVPAGSLDDTIDIKPNAHIFMSSKACWDEALEDVPKLQKLPQ